MEYQCLPTPDIDRESKDASPYPFISSSRSLEDGEISEGHFHDGVRDQKPLKQTNDQAQLHSPNQASTLTLTSPPAEPVRDAVEPMTKEDLEHAKSLVLDLLGWGVTPEYLVECGLSPSAIYKIFTDLRLRLPRNLVASPSPTVTS